MLSSFRIFSRTPFLTVVFLVYRLLVIPLQVVLQPLRNTEILSFGMQFPLCPTSRCVEMPSRILHSAFVFVAAYLKSVIPSSAKMHARYQHGADSVTLFGAAPSLRKRRKELMSMHN